MPGTSFSTANWNGYDEQSVTNPGGALTDFTLLIDISTFSATWKSEVQSDAGDIRCTKGDDTEIPLDVIDWAYNAGAPTGWIRCKWSSTLAASGTQNVRVWAGYNAGGSATAYDASETYGSDNAYDANWIGYWPLHDLVDRTSNSLDLTDGGTTTFAAAKVGDGADFTVGTPDYLTVAYTGTTAPPVTVMAWHKNNGNNPASEQYWWYYGDSSSSSDWHSVSVQTSGVMRIWSRDAHATALATGSVDVCDGTWNHFAGTIVDAGTTVDTEVYSNGSTDATGSQTSNPNMAAFDLIGIGMARDSSPSAPWDGMLDDVQFHSVERSADWIAEEYAQSNNQSTFWGTWAWTAVAAGFGGVNRIISGGVLV